MPTYDAEKCRDCDRRLATNSDVRCPCVGGRCEKCDALCWAAFHGGCQDPIDWRERYLAATQEVERLRAIVGTFDKRCADRLAEEVAVLVLRKVIDSRSPASDALLDYRDPPSTEHADRLAKADAECERLRRLVGEFESAARYTLGTLPAPGCRGAVETTNADWVAVHKGRAISAYRQLQRAVDAIRHAARVEGKGE